MGLRKCDVKTLSYNWFKKERPIASCNASSAFLDGQGPVKVVQWGVLLRPGGVYVHGQAMQAAVISVYWSLPASREAQNLGKSLCKMHKQLVWPAATISEPFEAGQPSGWSSWVGLSGSHEIRPITAAVHSCCASWSSQLAHWCRNSSTHMENLFYGWLACSRSRLASAATSYR